MMAITKQAARYSRADETSGASNQCPHDALTWNAPAVMRITARILGKVEIIILRLWMKSMRECSVSVPPSFRLHFKISGPIPSRSSCRLVQAPDVLQHIAMPTPTRQPEASVLIPNTTLSRTAASTAAPDSYPYGCAIIPALEAYQ
jgi:hypothetical protein